MSHHTHPEQSEPRRAVTLDASLAELLVQSQALRGDVRNAEAARKRTGKVTGIAILVLAIFIGLLVALTWQTNETNRRMADCTTPGGECYEQGRRRYAEAIDDVRRTSLLMSQCARLYPGEVGPTYDRKLEACVAERLAAADAQRPESSP